MDENAPSARHLGRVFGVLLLTALALCAGGLLLLGDPLSMLLILPIFPVIIGEGYIGMTVLGSRRPRFGKVYFVGRLFEGLLFVLGGMLAVHGHASATQLVFKLDLVILGVVSVPFYAALQNDKMIPEWLAGWGVAVYSLFGIDTVSSITTGGPISLFFSALGALFEAVAGVYLAKWGFSEAAYPTEAGEQQEALV